MSKCAKCGIEILDNTDMCPLCHSVVTKDADVVPMYPSAEGIVRKFRFIERLVLFASVVAMGGLVLANFIGRPFVVWTVIIGLILVYANTLLRMTITGKVGYQSKTLVLTFLAVGILIGIDALTGYNRWSLNVVLPSAILMLSLVVFILIFVNFRNWQSYIPMEILMVVTSLVLIIFYLVGIITYPNMVYIATVVSVLLLTGTVILGGDRAKRELYRRFHI